MSKTLRTFWHEANADCELDPQRLIRLYGQLQAKASPAQADQCSALLKHQMRKKLISIVSAQLEEAIVVQGLNTNRELKEHLKQLQEIDAKASQFIWERVVSEVYLLVEPEEIIREIFQLKEPELQTAALQSFLYKHLHSEGPHSASLIPLLTYRLNNLLRDKSSGAAVHKNLERLYRRLPKALRFLYESSQKKIGLLNYQHFEYLYAPRDNGPDAERRLPLTWIETKNSTDSDGHLMASFNEEGLVAFGSRFGASLKYLYADLEQQAAYFWIGSGLKSSQWWQVLWPHELLAPEADGKIMLENEMSKELLCAAAEYDENRRYVALLNAADHMDNAACFWLLTEF